MRISEWLIILSIFLLLLAAYQAGVFSGKRRIGSKKGEHIGTISNIQAGLMGILGVMLAFSFSLSSMRFEERRRMVIQESLSIGTAYFRAGLLPDSVKKEVRSLLEKYLDERIEFYNPENTYDDMHNIQTRSEYLQVQIWAKTAEIGRTNPSLNTNLTILALNSMIDIGGNISSSFQSRMPRFILFILTFITICTVLIMGYSHGLSQERNFPLLIVLLLVLCSILMLIMDMDTPISGFLKADIYSLKELKKEILKYGQVKSLNELKHK